MSLRIERVLIWGFTLVGLGILALFVPSPGYMDAQYYYLGGKALATGQGFFDPYIWNFLNDPMGLPQPSHLYWMPLPSVLSWLGMVITSQSDFFGGRLVFILLASLIPILTSLTAQKIGLNREEIRLASLLAIFSGFYWVYLTLPETFVPTLLLGGCFLLVISNWKSSHPDLLAGVLGLLCGLMHMTRADGLIWLVAAAAFIIWSIAKECRLKKQCFVKIAGYLLLLMSGYLLVSGAWYMRNLQLFGSLMPPGNSRALWIETYNQTFIYPASSLNFSNWLAGDWSQHVADRLNALAANLLTLVAVNGMIVLIPLSAAGIWALRRKPWIIALLAIAAAIFLAMTLAFPFAGARGGLYHSISGLQIFIWITAPVGLRRMLDWGERNRGWNYRLGWYIFSVGLLGICLIISVLIFNMRIAKNPETKLGWNAEEVILQQVEESLIRLGIPLDERIMVANPVGYYLVSGRQAVVTPDTSLDLLLQAAHQYQVCWLAVEPDHVISLQSLYLHPDSQEGFCHQMMVGKVQLFRLCALPECR